MKIYFCFALTCLIWFQSTQSMARTYVTADISHAGPIGCDRLKTEPGVVWWVEVEDQLLVLLEDDAPILKHCQFPITLSSVTPDESRLVFAALPLPKRMRGFVLAQGGRFAVVQLFPEQERPTHRQNRFHSHHISQTFPFRPNTCLARRSDNAPLRQLRAKRAETQALVDDLNPYRWFIDVYELHCFNRFTHNEQEMAKARDWLVEQFEKLPGVAVSLQDVTVTRPETSTVQNVVAVIPGVERPGDWFIAGAHYDSISETPQTASPGAEDNASGVAALLEMARVFSKNPPPATLVFICFAGEEQGLFGSELHAETLVTSGDNTRIKGVLNMDMIAFTEDDDFDILLETNNSGLAMVQALEDAAVNYTNLRTVTSLNPFGSDHVPYLDRGMPALLVIENDWNRYPAYHRSNDTIEWLDMDQGWEVLKMNVAALAEMMQ